MHELQMVLNESIHSCKSIISFGLTDGDVFKNGIRIKNIYTLQELIEKTKDINAIRNF